jgi:hypothetical protein
MWNFDCVPPIMQSNVDISILSTFVNYLAHMYEFLPQLMYHNHYTEQIVTHSIIRKVLMRNINRLDK